jgi:uncharacterized protein (TIGR02145 family)
MKILSSLIVVLLVNCNLVYSQVSITSDGTLPDNSAMLDVKSTCKGFLPPRLTSEQINNIISPAEGLIVYNTSDKHLYLYTTSFNVWEKLALANEGQWSCGNSLTIFHIAGDVAPVSKLVTYGTVISGLTSSTKCWITQNLGADHQATSATDTTETSAGWYWQFNKIQGYKHNGITRTPGTAWITYIDENADWITANDPCQLLLGTGWRLPTYTEWETALNNGGWSNLFFTFSSELKLHAAGYLYWSNGSLHNRGSLGLYWSSNQFETFSEGYGLGFNEDDCLMINSSKSEGLSVRCLKD